MGLLDKYNAAGIGLPRPRRQHQLTMAKLLMAINNKYKFKSYTALTESTKSDEDLDGKAPDVAIFDKAFSLVAFVEITTTRRYKKIVQKAVEYAVENNVVEAFVYDYEKKVWQKLSYIDSPDPSHSYSDLLKMDFDAHLED